MLGTFCFSLAFELLLSTLSIALYFAPAEPNAPHTPHMCVRVADASCVSLQYMFFFVAEMVLNE